MLDSPSDAPLLHLDGFEGPLDLLLALARSQRVDLARVSIRALVDQFVAALEAAGHDVPLPVLADWLVMATWLTLLKARLLLPADTPAGAQAQQDAAAILDRLAEAARMRAAASWLGARPQLGRDVFARGAPEPVGARRRAAPILDAVALMRACLTVLRTTRRPEVYKPRPLALWRVPEARARLEQLLGALPDGSALAQFLPPIAAAQPERDLRCRAALASTLVAGLELARTGALDLHQAMPFAPIHVHGPDHASAKDAPLTPGTPCSGTLPEPPTK